MLFGNVATNESVYSVMQSFDNENQKAAENLTTFACRLEALLLVAVENGHVTQVARNDMLRSKFWTGLRDEKLKILTRNKYDSILDFNRLLREVRSVDLELTASNFVPTPAQVSQQQSCNTRKIKMTEIVLIINLILSCLG